MRKPKILQGYDASYARDLDQRKSTTGYIFTVLESVVSWKTGLQDIVALSTTEVDTVEASKEAL